MIYEEKFHFFVVIVVVVPKPINNKSIRSIDFVFGERIVLINFSCMK